MINSYKFEEFKSVIKKHIYFCWIYYFIIKKSIQITNIQQELIYV